MTSYGKIASAGVRSWLAAPLCGTVLLFGCGNAASSAPSGSASASNAGHDRAESNQTTGDLPGEADGRVPAKEPRVVGYLPIYRIADKPALHLETLTHLNLAFAIPNSQGKVEFPGADESAIKGIVADAQQAKVKVLVAIGGGDGGKATSDSLALGVDAYVTSLLELIKGYNLDGVDVDIEGDDINPDTYGALMQTLSKRLAELPERKLLTAAVAEYRRDRYRALGAADFLNIMSYDQCGGWSEKACEHSTLTQAQKDLVSWANLQDSDANGTVRTIGRDNVVLGVPFYGRCWGEKCPERVKNPDGTFQKTTNLTYSHILAYCANSTFSGCSDSADVLSSGDEVAGYYVSLNSPSTIENKADAAKSYGGIMIWELGQDDANAPLFTQIAEEFPKTTSDSGF